MTTDTNSENPLKILHLSDLHFGSTFDPSLWDYVGKVLQGIDRPNVIVVTGDLVDTPSYFMLALARRELQELCKRWCAGNGEACELIVIPGNHDVGFWGNLATFPWRSKFSVVFANKRAWLFDRLPSFTQYMRQPWYLRRLRRALWILGFTFLWLIFLLRKQPRDTLVHDAAGGALCFACIDSNDQLALASGRIAHEDIVKIHGELLQRRLPGPDRVLLNLVPRIALVHHHVVAIPYSSTIESLTEFEPFLTLRNAGTLLRELCYWDFDLVLHGHKHLLNFVRLTFDSADQPRSEVAVLAAGSATKRQTVAGQNSFNLIKAYRNGCISFRSVRYGQGASGAIDGPWNTGFQRLLPLEELKLRAHTRACAGQQICCDSAVYEYAINSSGSANVVREVHGLRSVDEERLRKRHLEFVVSYGAIRAGSVRLDEASVDAGHLLLNAPQQATRKGVIDIQLAGQRITADVGTAYGVKWHLVNSFATSRWECIAMGQRDEHDWVSVFVRFPARRLKLSIELPETFLQPKPRLLVERSPDYPLLHIDEYGDITTAATGSKWVIDPDFTDLEKNNLRLVSNRWELDIEYPLVGHRYQVRWLVKTEVAPTTAERIGMALQLRRSLLKLVNPQAEPAIGLAANAHQILKKMTDQLLHPLLGSRYALDEQLDAALFVYDDSRKLFQLVAEGRRPDNAPLNITRIPLNAGISGAAFKHRGVSLYLCPECAESHDDGAYVYFPDDFPEENRPDYAALLAIPLHLGDLFPVKGEAQDDQVPAPPEEMIGIFTITTTARDNKLLGLTGVRDKLNAGGQRPELMAEIWTIAVQYLCGLSDTIRTAAQRP